MWEIVSIKEIIYCPLQLQITLLCLLKLAKNFENKNKHKHVTSKVIKITINLRSFLQIFFLH